MRRLIAILLLLGASGAFAGAQIYEPLSASVQAALHKAVSGARPPSSSFSNPMDAVEWLAEMSPRLEKRIPNREYRLDLLRSVHYEATRAGLDALAWGATLGPSTAIGAALMVLAGGILSRGRP